MSDRMSIEEKVIGVIVIAVSFFIIYCGCMCLNAVSLDINMDVIKQIESGGNVLAYNSNSGARGLYQITDVVRVEYNNYNKTKYVPDDLYNQHINYMIANWFITNRIPKMLKAYHKAVTLDNVLISYNAGISYVVKNKKLPVETVNYIKKYNKGV